MLYPLEETIGRVTTRRLILDSSNQVKDIVDSTAGLAQTGERGDLSINYFKFDGDGTIYCPKISLAQFQGKVFRLYSDEKLRQELIQKHQAYIAWLMFQTDKLPEVDSPWVVKVPSGQTGWIVDHSPDLYNHLGS